MFVSSIMRSIFVIMREKGLKLGTVFAEIDKTGDGTIDRSELRGGLETLTKSSDVSAFALERAREKAKNDAEIEAAEEKKRRDFNSKFEAAQTEGICDVMDKIGGVMRSRQMRIKDLYALKNAGKNR